MAGCDAYISSRHNGSVPLFRTAGMSAEVVAASRVFGAPTRLRILQLLGEGERTVAEIARECVMSEAAIRSSVNVLVDEGVVTTTSRRGRGGPSALTLERGRLQDLAAALLEALPD